MCAEREQARRQAGRQAYMLYMRETYNTLISEAQNRSRMNRKLETNCIIQNTKSKHQELVAELQVAGFSHSLTTLK